MTSDDNLSVNKRKAIMDFIPLTSERSELIEAVYRKWYPEISYYFPIGLSALRHTLFAQPEVHPSMFEMSEEASLIAVKSNPFESFPTGWVQAGYLSGIPGIPEDECDALIRCLMVTEGKIDVARSLLDRSVKSLSCRPIHAWRAFEHNSGYTFAAGVGKAPHRMKEVVTVLLERGFQQENINLVYAARELSACTGKEDLHAVEVQVLPYGWSEIGGRVRWDWFNFFEDSEKVGYATVTPVSRLTENVDENALFIKGIEVSDKHRRRGIGHLIMHTLWDYYRPCGINRLVLNTGDNNLIAQKFYRMVGFELTDKISSFLTNTVM